MIIAILIITGLVIINLILLVTIKWDQEYYWEDLNKRQYRMWDDIIKKLEENGNDQSHYLRAINKKEKK